MIRVITSSLVQMQQVLQFQKTEVVFITFKMEMKFTQMLAQVVEEVVEHLPLQVLKTLQFLQLKELIEVMEVVGHLDVYKHLTQLDRDWETSV